MSVIHALAALCYVVTTLLLLRGLLPHLTTHVFPDPGDPLLNTAILAWNARHVPLSAEWWNFPAFAPLSGVTAFTEHLLGAWPLATPIIWITGNPVLAYNLLLLASFPLAACSTYALVYMLTGSAAAALVGGAAFAFAPFQAVHLSHLQVLLSYGMPLALAGLHRYLQISSRGALLVFGIGWLLAALSNMYLLVLFSLFVVLWVIWFLHPRAEWRRARILAITALLASLPMTPLLYGYQLRQRAYGLQRGYDEMKEYSADVADLLSVSNRGVLWSGLLAPDAGEGSVFPGVTIAILALVGLTMYQRVAVSRVMRRRWSRPLLILAVTCVCVAALRAYIGPYGWHVGPLHLPRVNPLKVFSVGVAVLLFAIAASDRVRARWMTRDAAAFYAIAAVVMWLLALGPEPTFGSAPILYEPPYRWLLRLPGIHGLRVPARAWLPGVLCLAVLSGFGVARLVRMRSRLVTWTIAAISTALILGEGWFAGQVVLVPPPPRDSIAPSGSMVLDVPMLHPDYDYAAQYHAALGGYRVVNGQSGYFPPYYPRLRDGVERRRDAVLDVFRRYGDLYVIVGAAMSADDRLWIAQQPGAELTNHGEGFDVYRLPVIGTPPRVPLPLPREPGAWPVEIP